MAFKLPYKLFRPRGATIIAILLYFLFITIILKSTTLYLTSNSGNNLTSPKEAEALLKAFKIANTNRDNFLTIQEMGKYINQKITNHTEISIKLNPIVFTQIDQAPRDGVLTWDEYHRYFLKKHGMTEEYISDHSEVKHTKLNRKAREDMMRDKAKWAEAAKSDPFSLTIDEFFSFQHPESSTSNLLALVDDLLRLFDVDGDDRLTLDEFSNITDNQEESDMYRKSIISKTVLERRAEFTRIIDQNGDGKADRTELLMYVDPRHPRYALQEAATLLSLTDDNQDGRISIDEMIKHKDIYISSKMISTSRSFHEDFLF